jgi:hypothetical protein
MLLLAGIAKAISDARVVESADSLASGASALHGRGGSSPPSRTIKTPYVRIFLTYGVFVFIFISIICLVQYLRGKGYYFTTIFLMETTGRIILLCLCKF